MLFTINESVAELFDVSEKAVSIVSQISLRKKDFEVFNVGTGTGSSVLEVIQAFEKVSKTKLNYKIVGRREGDITSAFADTTLAKVELGWKTEKTLDEALLAAWQWQLKQ